MRVVVPTKATRTLLGIKKKRNKHQRIPNIGLKRRQQQGFVHMFTGRIRGSGGDRAGDDVVRMDRWPEMSGGESICAQQNKASPVLERGKDYLGSPMSPEDRSRRERHFPHRGQQDRCARSQIRRDESGDGNGDNNKI